MRLYIAEKPSMGNEIAKCLKGPISRHDGYLKTADGIVTWAFGHILRQAEPNEYDEKYKMWRAQDLPIIPTKWQMIIDKNCEKQFNIIKNLIEKADEIVHAGDPDREGQLLIDEIFDFVGNSKPVKRILLNALDEKSIKKANENLCDNEKFQPLKCSALARARADWLIGMNLSRAYTLAARRTGHARVVLPVGRVKTPTLALVVRRERELQDFKPVDYYTIKAQFEHANGSFWSNWKAKESQTGLDYEGRLVDKAEADKLMEKLNTKSQDAVISSYSKSEKKELQQLPFSLSALQVLAGKNFGYEPQQVLDTAQKLYERKMTTYPRSDCEYLPKNQFSDAKVILKNLLYCGDDDLTQWSDNADSKIKSKAWNDKKISAHHAIIPTQVKVKMTSLSEEERNIYFLIAQRYIAQFYPVHVYEQIKLTVKYAGENFQATGRVEKDLGWKILYVSENKKNEVNGDDDKLAILPAMEKNDSADFINAMLDQKATKPPTRFTPSTLLAGMKEIHKYVKNEDVKKKLKAIYGIGTEATRASIIDDLIRRKFLVTEGKKKYLIPTSMANMLVDALPDELLYPDFTAMWEDYLNTLANGDGSLDEFIAKQIGFTRLLCQKANDVVMPNDDGMLCPRCKKGVMIHRHGKNGDFWGCSNFPQCRMTCNDKDGKPDLSARTNTSRTAKTGNSMSGGMISAQELISRGQITRAKATNNKKYLCPNCKEGALRRIKGRNGYFWGCSNYPHCTANFADSNGQPLLGK
ncbi:DNA topoisomerase 3 [Pectinatus brassicae]|uniref:DNA topoisomerase n=1 Tax=Pectinatus brassicae TaxID=862415 RepID=A0A840UZ10_9FIRM|nr:DNA topoisomerase 3 [Pectinatus brassicae]MBB5337605.1 DNA topoisomerase-3 [Pectinatus brassicae]